MKISVNLDNPYNLSFVENVVLSYLTELYEKQQKVDFKVFDDFHYVELPLELMGTKFELSAFQQRRILTKLQEIGLVHVRLGKARSRYFRMVSDDAKIKREDILRQLIDLDLVQLKRVHSFIQDILKES